MRANLVQDFNNISTLLIFFWPLLGLRFRRLILFTPLNCHKKVSCLVCTKIWTKEKGVGIRFFLLFAGYVRETAAKVESQFPRPFFDPLHFCGNRHIYRLCFQDDHRLGRIWWPNLLALEIPVKGIYPGVWFYDIFNYDIEVKVYKEGSHICDEYLFIYEDFISGKEEIMGTIEFY